MSTDVLYLCKNRKGFTKFSLEKLFKNTDWGLVNALVIYDDGSTDGTRPWLRERTNRRLVPVQVEVRESAFGSPVAVMDDFLANTTATRFAKVDNDIVVPPGWLNRLTEVMDGSPELELLGAEAGRMGIPNVPYEQLHDLPRWWTPARHIGGVGLMRTESFLRRRRLEANGRFGFTEWQHEFQPVAGWVTPDLLISSLDQVPMLPWSRLAREYVDLGWAREWPKYHERYPYYWGWWAGPKAWEEYDRLQAQLSGGNT